jgi:hypothetical protein
MTDAVVTSFQAEFVVIDGGTYAIESAQMTFSGDGMNTMTVTLARGINKSGTLPSIFFSRGQEARLDIINGTINAHTNNNVYGSLFPQNFSLFRGVIEDFGPAQISPGVFALQVVVQGRLLWLATDSLNAAGIKANNYTDTTAVYGGQFGDVLPPFQLDPTLFRLDAANALKTSFVSIATALDDPLTAADYLVPGGVAERIMSYFGGNANSQVAATLAGVSGSLIWRDMSTSQADLNVTSQVVSAIHERLNEGLTYDWSGETYFNKYRSIGKDLYFRIIEVANDIRVAAYTPFFRSVDAYPLLPQTYSSVQWIANGTTSCRGVALTSGQGTDTSPDDLILGMYKMRGNPVGAVYVMEAPSILMSNNVWDRFSLDTGAQARLASGEIGDLGQKFAKFYTWTNNYSNRSLMVQCPTLRTDVGPLEAVRIDFPATRDFQAGLDTIAMYGSVMSVTITLDATRGQATTSYQVGHVRSYEQQTNLIDPDLVADEHPFFTSNYVGGRLDTAVPRRTSSAVSTSG